MGDLGKDLDRQGRRGIRRLVPVLLVLALAWPVAGRARGDDEEPMRRVDFQVERSRDVPNDRVRAIVGVTDEDADPAALADRVNQTMSWALAAAREAEDVEAESAGYRTQPVFHEGKLRRWRASQDLVLEAEEVEALSALVGTLQERLQLRTIDFLVSPERRREAEDVLIAEALAAFRARAELVRESLGASAYEIVRVSINAGGGPPPRPVYAEAAMRTASAVAPPSLEAGSSTLTVNLHGTIELE